ncbi:hypothetical protein AURDEDRAFT_159271 [Auricularia subglabra TFB-10046 SS5]|nr:hypothetical protein AURDEDRAFT_159271 [Auricularia subglabra TFB-10046 SS5]
MTPSQVASGADENDIWFDGWLRGQVLRPPKSPEKDAARDAVDNGGQPAPNPVAGSDGATESTSGPAAADGEESQGEESGADDVRQVSTWSSRPKSHETDRHRPAGIRI